MFGGLIGLLDGGGTLGDVADAVAMLAPHAHVSEIVDVLRALDVLTLGSDGLHRCEPVVVSCWPHRALAGLTASRHRSAARTLPGLSYPRRILRRRSNPLLLASGKDR